jgi:hypothetical protein
MGKLTKRKVDILYILLNRIFYAADCMKNSDEQHTIVTLELQTALRSMLRFFNICCKI